MDQDGLACISIMLALSWISMDYRGLAWISKDQFGLAQSWIIMDSRLYGMMVDYHELQWMIMDYRGLSWIIDYQGLWIIVDYRK